MKREVALELVREHEGKRPASLDVFLKYIDITNEEFNDMLIKHAISPYIQDFRSEETGKPLPDMDQWHLLD